MADGGSLAWYRAKINDSLAALTAAAAVVQGPALARAVQHALDNGKRVRGTLLLDFARSVAGVQHTATLPRGALDAAVGVELLQAASLVMDDLRCFDNSSTRRGRPATHVAFGERGALMAAVAMFALASASFGAAATNCGRSVHAEMMTAVLSAARGQLEEAETSQHSDALNALKTGALFAASTAAGAMIGGAPAARVAAARAAGAAFGALFQAADDAVDITEDGAVVTAAAARRAAVAADDALLAAALAARCASTTLERLRGEALTAVASTHVGLDGRLVPVAEG